MAAKWPAVPEPTTRTVQSTVSTQSSSVMRGFSPSQDGASEAESAGVASSCAAWPVSASSSAAFMAFLAAPEVMVAPVTPSMSAEPAASSWEASSSWAAAPMPSVSPEESTMTSEMAPSSATDTVTLTAEEMPSAEPV